MSVHWCCVCGQEDPPGMEVCPASTLGLTHLIAYGGHTRAMGVFNSDSAAKARAAMPEQEPTGGER